MKHQETETLRGIVPKCPKCIQNVLAPKCLSMFDVHTWNFSWARAHEFLILAFSLRLQVIKMSTRHFKQPRFVPNLDSIWKGSLVFALPRATWRFLRATNGNLSLTH